jgi:hypothetical protein
MPSDHEVNDPLLRSIAELRAEVNLLINEQVAYVRGRMEAPPGARGPRVGPSVMSVTEPPEEVTQVRPLDPRQRLDALAKHLDHRLRLASVTAPERTERLGPNQE